MAQPAPRSVVYRIQRKDGAMRWIEHFFQPVIGGQGEFMGVRASNRDVTERKQTETDRQRLQEELAHVTRVSTAGQLAASLAHELNQPLTAIRCNAETAQQLLASAPPDVAEVREALADIARDSERAGGVIQRLRALFKKTTDERSVLQINEIIDETLALLRSEFVLKAISTQFHLEPALPKVLGNRIELQQVVLNLAVNAMEAMGECEPGQRHLEIRTGCEGPGEIRASVRDSGPGIQVQPITRLFEPFFTTKPRGMGMGLAISQSIIEAHGGGLRAVNNPDRGATFQITLPIHHGEHA
jgi:C4-dicarboxylate-specific signal transduction histidine kinase